MTIMWKRELALLKIYQGHDLTLRAIEQRLAAFDGERVALDSALAQLREQAAAAQARREQLDQERRDEEQLIAQDKAHIADREAKQYAIKTNKEYQSAVKEIADARRSVKTREDRVLQLMEAAETAAKECTQLSAAIADKEGECQVRQAALQEEGAELRQRREATLAERQQTEQAMAKEMLEAYRYVQRRYPDGMALVSEGTCGGCHIRVPAQRMLELRRGQELISCTSCFRILYLEE